VVHYYCPFCWTEITKGDRTCTRCEIDIGVWDEKSFTEKLIQALTHSVSSAVYRACYILGEKRERAAIQPLIELLSWTNDYSLMEEIVETLGKIGDESAVPSLIDMLNNRSFLVRGKAASALSNLKGRKEVVEA
jgi:HEAT repeat protein